MNKIIEAQDILAVARDCVDCIFLAAAGLDGGLKNEGTDPIQSVANIATHKITEAIAILEEYKGGPNASQVTDEEIDEIIDRPALSVTAARTKRKGK